MTIHNLGSKTTAFQLQSSAVISATAAGQVGGAAAFLDTQQYEGDIVVSLDHAAAGSGVTLTAKIQESDSSGSGYTDVAGGAFTAAAANTAGFASLTLPGDTLKRYIRAQFTVTGGSGTGAACIIGRASTKYL
jgi:hypothetical protein